MPLDRVARCDLGPSEVVEQPARDREQRESIVAGEDVVEPARAGLAQAEVVADQRGMAAQVRWQLIESALDPGPEAPIRQALRLLPGSAIRM